MVSQESWSGGRSALCLPLACLGALGGAVAAIVRARSAGAHLAPWGALAFLDFVLLVLAGVVLGLAAAAVLLILGCRLARPARASLLLIVTAALLLPAAVAFLVILHNADRLLAALPEAGATDVAELPDVIVVIYDAVRADILYDGDGGVPERMPHLRGLAESGLVFRNAVAPAPWTLPSHASLFTGLTPLEHGAVEEVPVLRDEMETLAEVLKARGYFTAAVVANPWLSANRGFAQGFDFYEELWKVPSSDAPLAFRLSSRLELRHLLRTRDPRFDKGARLAGQISSRLIDRLPRSRPMLLFVNLIDAHPPYRPPWPYSEIESPDGTAVGSVPQDWVDLLVGNVVLNDAQRAILRALNQAEVAYLDEFLGHLLDSLRAADRFERSFIAITSDHGAGLGEEGLLGSGFDLREEMLRIPMIVRFPGGRSGGGQNSALVFLQDLFPTILQETGAGLDGVRSGSAHPLLAEPPREDGIASYSRPLSMLQNLREREPQFDASFLDRRLVSLRGLQWKTTWSSKGTVHMYDLSAAGERVDLGPSDPDGLRRQQALMELRLAGTPEAAWERVLAAARSGPRTSPQMTEATRKALQSLGYLAGDKN